MCLFLLLLIKWIYHFLWVHICLRQTLSGKELVDAAGVFSPFDFGNEDGIVRSVFHLRPIYVGKERMGSDFVGVVIWWLEGS